MSQMECVLAEQNQTVVHFIKHISRSIIHCNTWCFHLEECSWFLEYRIADICGNLSLRVAIELSCTKFYFCFMNWNYLGGAPESIKTWAQKKIIKILLLNHHHPWPPKKKLWRSLWRRQAEKLGCRHDSKKITAQERAAVGKYAHSKQCNPKVFIGTSPVLLEDTFNFLAVLSGICLHEQLMGVDMSNHTNKSASKKLLSLAKKPYNIITTNIAHHMVYDLKSLCASCKHRLHLCCLLGCAL